MKIESPLTLFEILRLFWRKRRIILVCLSLSYILASAYLLFSEKQYMTTMVISPVQDDSSAQIGNLIRIISGNDNPSPTQSDEFLEWIYFLKSPLVGNSLIQDERIAKTIFRGEWDLERKQWAPPGGLRSTIRRLLYRIFGYPTYIAPTGYRLSQYLTKALEVQSMKGSRLTSISIYNNDREFSVYLLSRAYFYADSFLRKNKIEKTHQTLLHLGKRIESVENLTHKKSLTELLMYYEQQLMLLETDQPFAARQLGEIFSSDTPTTPSLRNTLIVATALGLLLGGILVLFLNYRKRR